MKVPVLSAIPRYRWVEVIWIDTYTIVSPLSHLGSQEAVRCSIMRNDSFLNQFKVLIDIRFQHLSQFRRLLKTVNYHVRNNGGGDLLLFVNALKRTRIAATPAAWGINSLFAAAAPRTKSKARGYTIMSILKGLSVYTNAMKINLINERSDVRGFRGRWGNFYL